MLPGPDRTGRNGVGVPATDAGCLEERVLLAAPTIPYLTCTAVQRGGAAAIDSGQLHINMCCLVGNKVLPANHNAQCKDAGLNLLICAQARMWAAVAFQEGQDGQLNLLLTLSAVGQNGEDKQVSHRFAVRFARVSDALLVSHGSSCTPALLYLTSP